MVLEFALVFAPPPRVVLTTWSRRFLSWSFVATVTKPALVVPRWIARLSRWGLLKPSLIPSGPIRELRELRRYRKKLTEQASAEKNRIRKVLEDADIKVTSVAGDMFGVSGRAMLDALLAGDMSP